MRATRVITAIEAHAEGEPGRVITSGIPPLPEGSVFEKMQWMQAHADDLRLLMLREPRGHPALCCNLIVPPGDRRADAGFIVMEQTEYPPMSGSNTICVATVLLETGMIAMREPATELVLEAPAGLIRLRADCQGGKVTRVTFRNVPAFALHLGAALDVPDLGRIQVDIAWGGMFYVLADAGAMGIGLGAENGAEIVRASERILAAARAQLPVAHPENPAMTGPTITNLFGAPARPGTHGRQAVTVSSGGFDPARPQALPGVLDRSPCGTGLCARMAVLHAKGELRQGDDFTAEGPLGTTFTGRIEETTTVGRYPAIVPSLSGQGWITGMASYLLDPSDPFPQGYRVGDIWA